MKRVLASVIPLLLLAVAAGDSASFRPPLAPLTPPGGDPVLAAQEAYEAAATAFLEASLVGRDPSVERIAALAAKDAWVLAAAPQPSLTSAAPGALTQGQTDVSITLAGTEFRDEGVVTISGLGATVTSQTRASGTSMTIGVDVDINAAPGLRDIVYTQPWSGLSATLAGALTIAMPPGVPFAWTDLAPSSDSRVIFVSSSTGLDTNNGLSAAAPVKTLVKGQALLRTGFPDWISLLAGDVWTGESLNIFKSGRSKAERMVVASYGTGPRPAILNGNIQFRGSYLAFTGVSIRRTVEAPAVRVSGIESLSQAGGSAGILIEDCYIEGFGVGIQLQGFYGRFNDVAVRGSVMAFCYSTVTHSQGLFCDNVDNLLVEGCVIDHCGWSETVAGDFADDFSHDAYLQYTCTGVVTRNNIFSRGASSGLQQRSGGLCEDNLFLMNTGALDFGYHGYTAVVSGIVRRNVILDGRDLGIPGGARGWGVGAKKLDGVDISDNIIAHNEHGTSPQAFSLGREFGNATVRRNIVYDWAAPTVSASFTSVRFGTLPTGPVDFSDNIVDSPRGYAASFVIAPDKSLFKLAGNRYFTTAKPLQWFFVAPQASVGMAGWASLTGEAGASDVRVVFPDPGRTIATYSASLGFPASLDGFMAEARKQSKSNWRTVLTAKAAGDYIRAGFGR